MKLLPSLLILIGSLAPVNSAIVKHTFTGLTTVNQFTGTAFNTAHPVGTEWMVEVEWDDAATPLFTSDTQSQFRLTKFTFTLKSKSRTWTTSSLPEKASFGFNKSGSALEVQFTSGWGPDVHTDNNLAGETPYSINLTLVDPSGKAVASIAKPPSFFDEGKWDLSDSKSQFKAYLSQTGGTVVYGSIGGQQEPQEPEIGVVANGKRMVDGNSALGFGARPVGSGVRQRFVIKNTGTSPLRNLIASKRGRNAADFLLSKPGRKTIPAGASTSVFVTFKPRAVGRRAATLVLTSNDGDESPFTVILNGRGLRRTAR